MALLPGETQVHTAGSRRLWEDGTDTQRLTHTEAEQKGEDHKDCGSAVRWEKRAAPVSHPPLCQSHLSLATVCIWG